MGASFLDTNVLLYLVSTDDAKADRAEALVAQGGVVSVQVLNEFANVARRKAKLAWEDLHAILAALREVLDVRAMTLDVHMAGLAIAERYRLSIYDAMIVASASEAGADILWSEDMQHGLVFDGGPRLLNPFRLEG